MVVDVAGTAPAALGGSVACRAMLLPDDELRAILAHNRDEEKEHAAMLLEWLRRHDAEFDEQLRDYLFSEGSIVEAEQQS